MNHSESVPERTSSRASGRWVAGLAESHQPGYWSHGYTFVVLAALAYAAGVTILPASIREYYAAWLAWLALSICFLNAFYFKMHEGRSGRSRTTCGTS